MGNVTISFISYVNNLYMLSNLSYLSLASEDKTQFYTFSIKLLCASRGCLMHPKKKRPQYSYMQQCISSKHKVSNKKAVFLSRFLCRFFLSSLQERTQLLNVSDVPSILVGYSKYSQKFQHFENTPFIARTYIEQDILI